MNGLRVPLHTKIYRLSRLALHLLKGLALAGAIFPVTSPSRRDRLASRWASRLLDILHIGLSIRRHGCIPARAAGMYVANHISWIDIVALKAVVPAQFVAKSEIRRWPIIGWLARRTGTLFIERRKPRDMIRVLDAIRTVLRNGDAAVMFPEGTTSDGTRLKPFHTGLLQAAIDTDTWIRPVAIRYLNRDNSLSFEPAYIEEISLVRSIWRVVGQASLRVELAFGEPLSAREKNRRELARHAATRIAASLQLSRVSVHGRHLRRRRDKEETLPLSLWPSS